MLNLYVWNGEVTGADVLCDWMSGLIVAVAPSLDEALAQIDAELDRDDYRRGFARNNPDHIIPLRKGMSPVAYFVSGGS